MLQPPPKILSHPRFLLAAHTPGQWPPDEGMEVAFAGRSNVGKSSAINTITQRRALARASRTPGRTQQIVFFQLSETQRLVDLPGYGYAKVPMKLRHHWSKMIERYLTTRRALRGLVLLMDARHPLTPLDVRMLEWSRSADLAIHVLLTKIDKLSRNQAALALREVRRKTDLQEVTVQPFSAVDYTGVDEVRSHIVRWFCPDDPATPKKQVQ